MDREVVPCLLLDESWFLEQHHDGRISIWRRTRDVFAFDISGIRYSVRYTGPVAGVMVRNHWSSTRYKDLFSSSVI
ncbi:hypothetical protein TNCV_4283761 [Trichonephila clavipes]|nr:hypothetical protein TNCV_4283761 [Trichonephila clavipes]